MEIICIDTNLLIDYFRKGDKSETWLYKLAQNHQIVVPAIVAYEFLRGQKGEIGDQFLELLLDNTGVLPFDGNCAHFAAAIYKQTKSISNIPDPQDLLIAATALGWGYRLATNNKKHFENITDLQLV